MWTIARGYIKKVAVKGLSNFAKTNHRYKCRRAVSYEFLQNCDISYLLVYKKTDSRSRLFVFDILLVKIFEIFSDKLASLLYAVNRTQWV